MAGKRDIAVIGSNSFSGADFIDLLLEDPRNRVLGVSRSPEKSPLYLHYRRRRSPRFEYQRIDLNRHLPRLLEILDEFQPSHVINFAAQSEVAPSWEHPDQWFRTNTVALAELINALRKQPWLERYVHISSPEVYGTCSGRVDESAPLNPSTPYAASKAAADLLLAAMFKGCQFPVITIRATNVYGPGQQLFKIIPRTVINLKLGRRTALHGGGAAVKSYIHIRDVSRGELAAMEKGEPGRMYHLSPDRGYAVRDVVSQLCELVGEDFEASTEVVGERLGQDAAYVIDSSRARQELGWRPQIPLEDGLRQVVGWIDENWDAIQNEPLEYVHRP